MKINGRYVLNAEINSVWQLLQEQEVLARISPGISRIEKTEADQYKAISEINIGPVRGSFEGNLTLKDKKEYEAMTMVLEQNSTIGGAKATIIMNLNALADGQTEIIYEGDAHVSGRLATMGQRILGGVIKTLSKQVFKELDVVIKEQQATEHVGDSQQLNSVDFKDHKKNDYGNDDDKKKSFLKILIDKILSIWK